MFGNLRTKKSTHVYSSNAHIHKPKKSVNFKTKTKERLHIELIKMYDC